MWLAGTFRDPLDSRLKPTPFHFLTYWLQSQPNKVGCVSKKSHQRGPAHVHSTREVTLRLTHDSHCVNYPRFHRGDGYFHALPFRVIGPLTVFALIVCDMAVTIDSALLREKLLISSQGFCRQLRCAAAGEQWKLGNGLSLLHSIILLNENGY